MNAKMSEQLFPTLGERGSSDPDPTTDTNFLRTLNLVFGGEIDLKVIKPWMINALCKLRKTNYQCELREEISAKSREIEERATFTPVDMTRPYGLPEELVGTRSHVWELILTQVSDPTDIINLSNVCTMFRDLLREKYLAVRLPEIAKICLNNSDPPDAYHNTWLWNADEEQDGAIDYCLFTKSRLHTMLPFRQLCKLSKTTVENQFVGEPEWKLKDSREKSKLKCPFPLKSFKSVEELQEIINDLKIRPESRPTLFFPGVKLCEFDPEVFRNGVQFSRIMDLFPEFLEMAGSSIRRFVIIVWKEPGEAYNLLRRWTKLMPNLESLEVGFLYHNENINEDEMPALEDENGNIIFPIELQEDDIIIVRDAGEAQVEVPLPPAAVDDVENVENLEPFPTLPFLQIFKEFKFHNSLPIRYVEQILLANPTIRLLHLSQDLDLLPHDVLQNLQLEMLTSGQHLLPLPQSVLERNLNWPLRKIVLITYSAIVRNAHDEDFDDSIPPTGIFRFLNRFKSTLKELVFDYPISDDEGFLNLPNLTSLHWTPSRRFRNLEFILPMKNLEHLVVSLERFIALSACSYPHKRMTVFGRCITDGDDLFPKLRRVKVHNYADLQRNMTYQIIF